MDKEGEDVRLLIWIDTIEEEQDILICSCSRDRLPSPDGVGGNGSVWGLGSRHMVLPNAVISGGPRSCLSDVETCGITGTSCLIEAFA